MESFEQKFRNGFLGIPSLNISKMHRRNALDMAPQKSNFKAPSKFPAKHCFVLFYFEANYGEY
jgi:hypothetical protein